MKNELDEFLTRALTPREEPGDVLNRKILNRVKERVYMKQKKYKRASVAVIAAAFVAASSITAVAAWQYMSASQVADHTGDERLAGYFADQMSEQGVVTDPPDAAGQDGNADIVGESQSYGGYKVTVLGLLSGENMSEYRRQSNGNVRSDRTYCVVAIERENGEAVDPEHEDFFVSPLIGGLEPGVYNAASLCGNYSEFIEDGVLYRLLECDNIECFADRELYLCVTDTSFYNTGLYHYDEGSGNISRNMEYDGLNALFELKMDVSLADPVKAQALIDEISEPAENDEMGVRVPKEAEDAMEWAGSLTSENLERYCVRLENTVQTVTVNEEGYYVIQPWLVNEAVSDTRGSEGEIFNSAYYTPEEYTQGVPFINGYSGASMEELVITTFTINEDGSMTFAAWVPREVSRYFQ
ncbi:MAG: hypothetical protein K2O97_03795 [Acetatifactor sp.]|nr:hypothetical protein [Acetatifactor sp.]